MSNPSTTVEIGGDNSGLKKSLNESGGLVAKFAANMASVQTVAAQSIENTGGGFSVIATKGLGAVAGVAATVGAAAIAMASNTAAAANEINRLSAQSGLGAADMAKLTYAFNVNNVSAQDLGMGLKGIAVKMNEAAHGNAEAQSTFKALGVEVKDASGKMRPINDVLLDVAESFKKMPDGATKSALAVKLMEESGLKLLPVLNQGAAAIRKFGDEAENIGIVFTPEQLAAAKEWEQNMVRLKAVGTGFAHSVGNEIIPHLAHLSSILLENKGAGLGWFESFIAMLSGGKNPAQQVSELTEKLSKMKAELAADIARNKQDGGATDTSALEKSVAQTETALQYYTKKAQEAANAVEIAETASAEKRADLEQRLATKKADLAKYVRYIQTGEQALIEGNAKASVDRQVADQQRLADAVRSAWQKTRQEAETAQSASKNLADQAQQKRAQTADKVTNATMQGLPQEEQIQVAEQKAKDFFQEGRFYAASAGAARIDGRLEQMQQYQQKAEEALKRAESFAEKSGKPDLIDGIGKEQAGLLDNQAKAKQQEAAQLQDLATQQAATLNDVEAKLQALKESARSIEVSLKTDDLKTNIAEIEGELSRLTQPRTIPVNIAKGSSNATEAPVLDLSPYGPGYASGGHIRGPGSGTSDSILARLSNGEYVIRAAAVDHYGPSLLSKINSMSFPKFASGGLVSRSGFENVSGLRLPTLPAAQAMPGKPSGSTVVLDFGKLGRYQTNASDDVAAEIAKVFKRSALSHGRR